MVALAFQVGGSLRSLDPSTSPCFATGRLAKYARPRTGIPAAGATVALPRNGLEVGLVVVGIAVVIVIARVATLSDCF